MSTIQLVRRLQNLSSSKHRLATLFNGCQTLSAHHHLQSHHRRLSQSSTSNDSRLRPYVALPYSYAYGRSDKQLIYKTLGDLIVDRANTCDGQPYILSHYEQIEKNFSEFNTDVCRVAKSLNEKLGIQRGDVVGLWSQNSYNWIVLQFAVAKIGAILSTINPYYQGIELDYVLRKAQVKVLLLPGKNSHQEVVNRFSKVLTKALNIQDKPDSDPLLLKHLITIDGEQYSDSDLPEKCRGTLKHHQLETLFDSNGDVSSKLLSSISPDDPSVIMFTSGTTGKPKGAVLSQFTILNNSLLTTSRFGKNNTFVIPLPFFHSFAGILGNVGMIAGPFKLVIPCLKYDVKQVVEAINTHKATYMMATPTLVIDLLNYLNKTGIEIPSFHGVISGGASMPIESAHQFCETVKTCTDFRIGYGSTELGPCSTACHVDDSFEMRTESVGTPLDFVEIKVIDPETMQLVKCGETGEIYSRGFNTMLGYWRDEAKTKEVIDPSGWYCTGDLGTLDEKGNLKIVGRTKDMIIVGGENVYPVELEDIIHTFPGVSDAHVIGVPDDRRGEAVCAWIQMLPDHTATEEEVRKFCEKNMAYFKVPKYFRFVDSFPMTSTGKAQKFLMQEITIKELGLGKK